MQLILSFVFTIFLFVWTFLYAIFFVIACSVLPIRGRYALTRVYARSILGGLALLCGLRFEVRGAENFPAVPHVQLWKHASAWETIGQFLVGPAKALVLKVRALAGTAPLPPSTRTATGVAGTRLSSVVVRIWAVMTLRRVVM